MEVALVEQLKLAGAPRPQATAFQVWRNEAGEQVYHLLNDFGLYKATLKRKHRQLDRGESDEWWATCKRLLARRGQWYTLAEIKEIAALTMLLHDDCVLDNPDEYTRVEVWTSERNERNLARVERIIAMLEATA